MYIGNEKRKSYYNIGKNIPISDEELIELVKEVTLKVPDAVNMQSQRVILALGEKQDQLWDKVYDVFEGQVAREKIDGFKAGHGTILYYIDTDTVEKTKEAFPLYAHNFNNWAQNSNGMLQYALWSELRAKEIGASLQHYNPIIDEAVAEMFNVPKSWKLIGQMPFGEILEEPEAKEAMDINERVKIYK